jgi:hypothetical protein
MATENSGETATENSGEMETVISQTPGVAEMATETVTCRL